MRKCFHLHVQSITLSLPICIESDLLPSLASQHLPLHCYYCTITNDRVCSDSTGFCALCRNVGRPIRLQEQAYEVLTNVFSSKALSLGEAAVHTTVCIHANCTQAMIDNSSHTQYQTRQYAWCTIMHTVITFSTHWTVQIVKLTKIVKWWSSNYGNNRIFCCMRKFAPSVHDRPGGRNLKVVRLRQNNNFWQHWCGAVGWHTSQKAEGI